MPHTSDAAFAEARALVTREDQGFLRNRADTASGLSLEPTDSQAVLEMAAVFGGPNVYPCRTPGSAYAHVTSALPDATITFVNAPANAISAWLFTNWGVNISIAGWGPDTELTIPTPWLDLYIAPTTSEDHFPRAFAIQGGHGGLIIVQGVDGSARPVRPVRLRPTPTRHPAPGAFLVSLALRHLGVLEPLTAGLRLTGIPDAQILSWDPPIDRSSHDRYRLAIQLLERSVSRSARVRFDDSHVDLADPLSPLTLIDDDNSSSLRIDPGHALPDGFTTRRPVVRRGQRP